MILPTFILPVLIILSICLAGILVLKPTVTRDRGGKILAFVSFFILPVAIGTVGTFEHLERSKETEFCLSCHTMEPYGRSLYVDDKEYTPANHFQNNRVPSDRACYTCHTDYTMYGDFNAKLRGLKHLYVQYLGTIPDTIKLYSEYNNRECLHCHEGARSFEEQAAHDGILASIKSNELSCLTSGCHGVVHNVHELSSVRSWKGNTQ